MELKERKRINNLPKFRDGLTGYDTDLISLKQLAYGGDYDMPEDPTDINAYKQKYYDNDKYEYDPNKYGPKTSDSNAAGMGPWFALGAWLGGGVAEGIGAVRKTSDDIRSEQGTSNGSVAGFGYQKENLLDVNKYMKDYKIDAGADFLTNPARALTKFFGIGHAKRQANEAYNKAVAANQFNRSGAMSDYLNNEYNMNHYNSQNGYLHAKNGKDTWTPAGLMPTTPNAKVSAEEGIVDNILDPAEIEATYVNRGVPNADDQYATLTDSSVVFGKNFKKMAEPYVKQIEANNKMFKSSKSADKFRNSSIGKRTDELNKQNKAQLNYEPTMVLNLIADAQRMYHANIGNDGLVHAKYGFAGNNAIGALGSLMGVGKSISAALQKRSKPHTYVANPYENYVLAGLNNLKMNPYPMMDAANLAQRRAQYEATRGGGVTGNQAYLANVANAIAGGNTAANVLYNTTKDNIELRKNALTTMLGAGTQQAQQRQQADQWDYAQNAASHNAKWANIYGGLSDTLAQAQQWYANADKLNQFNRMYSLYSDELDAKKKELIS